jgi:5-methylcytosine-specific restriction endonuclease McrA
MKPSISKLKKKLDPIFKKFIRLRDCNCLRCGATTNLQASHTIPVSHGNRLRYDEKNLITLCYHCHLNWWHKNPIEAGEWFKGKFPVEYAYVEAVKNEHKKFTVEELEEMIKRYTQKVKELENACGGLD